SICQLPRLENFNFSYNFFTGEPPVCIGLPGVDDRRNCIPTRPAQRSPGQCAAFLSLPPVNCASFGCGRSVTPRPRPPVVVPSPPTTPSPGGSPPSPSISPASPPIV